MATPRQNVRDRRAERNQRARDKRISIDDLKKENRSSDTLNRQVGTLVNEPTPRLARERLQDDIPVLGAFDSTNIEFSISSTVLGNNIFVYHTVAATGTTTKLTRTTSPAPAGGSFYFDNVQTIRVGDAPAPADALFAVYLSPR